MGDGWCLETVTRSVPMIREVWSLSLLPIHQQPVTQCCSKIGTIAPSQLPQVLMLSQFFPELSLAGLQVPIEETAPE